MTVLQLGQEIPDDITSGIQKSLPGQILTETIGVRMRDDRCPVFNGKPVLSKHKQENIRKTKQNKTVVIRFFFIAFVQMVWKVKLTTGRTDESGRQIGRKKDFL